MDVSMTGRVRVRLARCPSGLHRGDSERTNELLVASFLLPSFLPSSFPLPSPSFLFSCGTTERSRRVLRIPALAGSVVVEHDWIRFAAAPRPPPTHNREPYDTLLSDTINISVTSLYRENL